MKSFLDRDLSGQHEAVWDDLMALGAGVRHELYIADAVAVAAETMRRARRNIETLIRRLEARGYRFQDEVSQAEDQLARFAKMDQAAARAPSLVTQDPAKQSVHVKQMLEGLKAAKAKMAPMMEKARAEAAKAAARKRKPPLEDKRVFSPPDANTKRGIAKLEKAAGGPLPISLHAWYEQVGGVSLMGSDALLNPQPVAQDSLPDPLVVEPIEHLLMQAEDGDDSGGRLQLVIAPDDLHKADISGDAYYLTLPDQRADFIFDDGRKTGFVSYLRRVFQWGGFPGWDQAKNPPREAIEQLSRGLEEL